MQSENGGLAISGVARARIPELVAALVSAGVRVYRVAPQEPSLEEVYFALQNQPADSSQEVDR